MVYPTRAESARLKRQRRPVQAKVQLLDLTGKDVTIENVAASPLPVSVRLGLPCRRPRPPAAAAGAAGGVHRGAGAGSGAGARATGRRARTSSCTSSATGRDLNIGNVADFAFDKAGRFLALVIDAPRRQATASSCRAWSPRGGQGPVTATTRRRTSASRGPRRATGSPSSGAPRTSATRTGLRGHRVQGLRCDQPRENRLRPGNRQGVPRGHVHQPVAPRHVDRGPDGVALRLRRQGGRQARCQARRTERRRSGRTRRRPRRRRQPRRQTRKRWTWSSGTTRLQSQQQVQEESDKNFSFLSIYRVKENSSFALRTKPCAA